MPGAETFRASADAYDRLVGRYGTQLASALIDFAGLQPGMRALDVGCGPGALTAALAGRLGTASVGATDPSEPFVEACRARLPGIDVVVGAAEAVPLGDGTFDATLSQLVVNFMSDAEAGLREMGRVTRRAQAGSSPRASGITRARLRSCAHSGMPPARSILNAAAADEGVVMRWCAEGELAGLWRAAGLRDVRFGPLVVSTTYTDFQDLWSPLPTGVALSGAFCKSLDEERRAALHDALRRRRGVGDAPFETDEKRWRRRRPHG